MGNKTNKKFSSKRRLQSFSYAFNGLKILFKEEHNARIHLVITIAVIAAGIFFRISPIEWIVVCALISLVLAMEIVNSAIENLCDYVNPKHSESIKKTKDLAAAAVLIVAIASATAGFILFMPKLSQLLN